MDPLSTASAIVGAFCIGCGAISIYAGRQRSKARAERVIHPHSLAYRLTKQREEVQKRRSAEKQYQDSIDDAFKDAMDCGALLISEVEYYDIERDRRIYFKEPRLLTRITPILTHELAEKIRDEEVVEARGADSVGRAEVYQMARSIKWRVEEVPVKYEPPNLKDTDRITYPELSEFSWLPPYFKDAARKMLGYDNEYVRQQAKLLDEQESSFQVSEE